MKPGLVAVRVYARGTCGGCEGGLIYTFTLCVLVTAPFFQLIFDSLH